jgi:hypothetical protein
MNMINDMQLRQYIDQVFMRYDFNRTGTLNLPELHVFLNELFQMCGHNRMVSYQEAYAALVQMDSNRDGQINKYELFNLFRYLTQPGFNPLPYSHGNYTYGMGGVGMGNMGGFGGSGMGGMGGLGMGGMGMGGMGMGGVGMGGVGMSGGLGGLGGGYGGVNTGYGGSYSTTTTTTSYPQTGLSSYGTGLGGNLGGVGFGNVGYGGVGGNLSHWGGW